MILALGLFFGFILGSIFYYDIAYRNNPCFPVECGTNSVDRINRTCYISGVRVCGTTEVQEGSHDGEPQLSSKVYKLFSRETRRVTAYNVGDVSQSDNSPCNSANGEDICRALDLGYTRCGANFVPFGTKLIVSGIGECLVTDRMNERYPNDVDIAMKLSEKQKARDFGVQYLEVSILYEVNE